MGNNSLEIMEEFKHLENPYQIKIAFMKELRADGSRYSPGIIRFSIFCLQVSIQKYDSNTQKYTFACCLYGCKIWSLPLREEQRLRI
jgi:hypothetical protein